MAKLHTIKPFETWQTVASKYKVSIYELKSQNIGVMSIARDLWLPVGAKLVIPESCKIPQPLKKQQKNRWGAAFTVVSNKKKEPVKNSLGTLVADLADGNDIFKAAATGVADGSGSTTMRLYSRPADVLNHYQLRNMGINTDFPLSPDFAERQIANNVPPIELSKAGAAVAGVADKAGKGLNAGKIATEMYDDLKANDKLGKKTSGMVGEVIGEEVGGKFGGAVSGVLCQAIPVGGQIATVACYAAGDYGGSKLGGPIGRGVAEAAYYDMGEHLRNNPDEKLVLPEGP